MKRSAEGLSVFRSPSLRVAAGVAAVALIAGGCGSNGAEEVPTITAAHTVESPNGANQETTPSPAKSFEPIPGTVYRTDDPTGAKVGVNTYADPRPNGNRVMGHFNEGQTVQVLCELGKEDGTRPVYAEVHNIGLPDQSYDWYQLQRLPGGDQFTPTMYVDVHGAQVPDC